MGKGLILVVSILLASCSPKPPTDVFCATHTATDFRPTQKEFDVLTSDQKKRRLQILEEGAQRCGWKPNE